MNRNMFVLAIMVIGLVAVNPAYADTSIYNSNGWKVDLNGWVNGFALYQNTQKLSAGNLARIADDNLQKNNLGVIAGNSNNDSQGFRVQGGYVPAILGFSLKAPTIDGLDMGIRMAMYPNIHNNRSYTSFGTDFNGPRIDFRELNFTVAGKFGELLIGRALHLYQGKNCLTDMVIPGVGLPGPTSFGVGAGFGHVGTGYLYPAFGAQIRYTTPDFAGYKFALELADPSVIKHTLAANDGATKTNLPALEAELSYAGTNSAGKFQAWLDGFWDSATFVEGNTVGKASGSHATSLGGAAGVQQSVKDFEVTASAYGGQALGSAFMPDWDALDATGAPRMTYGFFTQATYNVLPSTKVGINYGQSNVMETGYEQSLRTTSGKGQLKRAQSATVGVYHDVNKFLKLIAEASVVETTWYSGVNQRGSVIDTGASLSF